MNPSSMSKGPSLFRTFWMGGFEGADHINSHGQPLSLNSSNGHWDLLDHDYALLAEFGIRTVRESVGWRASHTANGLDLRRLEAHAVAARRHGIQVVWTLSHYGMPAGVDLFAADFPTRFAAYCEQVARCLKPLTDGAPLWQPINEISFLSWAASATRLIHPYRDDSPARGFELKCNLVRAALQGCDALWSVDPAARIVHTDPVIHVTAAPGACDTQLDEARQLSAQQFQAWDMLCGRLEPALGGAPRYLDVLGINYYHSNQWEHPSNERLHWHLGDPRRRDPSDLLGDVWRRYGRPLFIAETGHVGEGRARWLDHVAEAAQRCQQRGIPLEGICLYPVIDRPDWEDLSHWHRSGLWDVPDPSGALATRVLHMPYAERLRHWQRVLPAPGTGGVTAEPPPADGLAAEPPGTGPCSKSLSASLSTCPCAPPVPASVPFPPFHRGTPMPTLIVFSHLRWDFVYQRPQQLLTRLARQFRVVFVEEPVPGSAQASLERLAPIDGVEVLRPHLPGHAHGFHDDHIPALRILLAEYLSAQSIDRYWLWFYTPMAMPLAAELTPQGIVYDCMDELAAFKNAPRQLLQRENALFKAADLVFTGGRSLYEAKRERHERVYCFPSSVDAAHFSRAQRTAGDDAPDHPAQSHIAHPRLGFFGVIDERIDLALIAALADARADWQVVMVGPVVKIDPATLPQRPNIHWLGQRGYAELPT
ncbi:MAG: glycosyl transferase group 1, partial [Variovorax sp.]|nr:glycosyl transferase group 1 [Variovorax sp.]